MALGVNSGAGPARSDLAEGLRYFPVGRYVLLYREIAGGAKIVRCVRGLVALTIPKEEDGDLPTVPLPRSA